MLLLQGTQSVLANAQAAPTPAAAPPLRLDSVYALVAARSPRAQAAVALARAAQARVAGASRPPDPDVQLGFMNYTLPSVKPDPALGMTQLQVMQMVPLPGKLSAAVSAARARADAARARATDAAWEARSAAAMAYYERYEAAGSVAIARQTRRLLEDVAEVASAMYRVGDGRQADVCWARVEIARMDEEVVPHGRDARGRDGATRRGCRFAAGCCGRRRCCRRSRTRYPHSRPWRVSRSRRGRCSPLVPPTCALRPPTRGLPGASCGPTCRLACSTASDAWKWGWTAWEAS
ncbi:MAG: TolC family protein [Gemmatimonadetes bacterium]|nr:TolC family protein [Gemmatimonadota bacterium]